MQQQAHARARQGGYVKYLKIKFRLLTPPPVKRRCLYFLPTLDMGGYLHEITAKCRVTLCHDVLRI